MKKHNLQKVSDYISLQNSTKGFSDTIFEVIRKKKPINPISKLIDILQQQQN